VYFPYLCVFQLVDTIGLGFVHSCTETPPLFSFLPVLHTPGTLSREASGTVSQPTARLISSLALPSSSLLTSWLSLRPGSHQTTPLPRLLSSAFSFSHTSRLSGRGGGTGLLISPKWCFSLYPLPLFTPLTFEFHAVTVTHPVQLNIVVLYRPPGSLGDFLEELDVLLSKFSENSPPLILLGDFNIQTEKSCDLLLLLSTFDLSLSPSPPTHKAGNHLDYIFTRNCSTSNLTVTPLHVSDHFFISYSLSLSGTDNSPISTDSASVCRSIRTLCPSSLAYSVLSALPSTDSSLMHPNSATDALLCLHLSILFVLLRHDRLGGCLTCRAPRATLRASKRKWWKSNQADDLLAYQSLLFFSASISATKSSFYLTKILSFFFL